MWIVLIVAAILAWCFPRLFDYLVLVPLLGTCVGGFTWGVLRLVGVMPWGYAGFGGSLLFGMAVATHLARKDWAL